MQTKNNVPAAGARSKRLCQLAPVLLALAVSHAYADTTIGRGGTPGKAGTVPGSAGTSGGNAQDLAIAAGFSDAANPLQVIAGAGGKGGNGAAGAAGQAGGAAGAGGAGGNIAIDLHGSPAEAAASSIGAVAGDGGAAGMAGAAGAGATAGASAPAGAGGASRVMARLSAAAVTTGDLKVGVFVNGGNGGTASTGNAGAGGRGHAELLLNDIGTRTAAVSVYSTGGNGGAITGNNANQALAGTGADGTARSELTASGALTVDVYGAGGNGGTHQSGSGGDGGNGNVISSAQTSGSNGELYNVAIAQGGNGGNATGLGRTGGMGGTATTQVSAQRLAGRTVAMARATGGNGGAGLLGAAGGRGGSVELINAVTGSTSADKLLLTQNATGGNGGASAGSAAGMGGNAVSRAALTDERNRDLAFTVEAFGGTGGKAESGDKMANGGSGTAVLTLTSTMAGGAAAGTASARGGSVYFLDGSSAGLGGHASARSVVSAERDAFALADARGGAKAEMWAGTPTSSTDAFARAVSAGSARAEANGIGGGAPGSKALVRAEAIGGQGGAYARAEGRGEQAKNGTSGQGGDVSAYSSAHGAARNVAEAVVFGGTANARSVSTAPDGSRVETSMATVGVKSSWNAISSANIGGTVVSLSSGSHATLAPDAAAASRMLDRSPEVAAAFARGETVAVGVMGSMSAPSYQAARISTANFQFTTTGTGYLTLGLLQTSMDAGSVGDLSLTVSSHGTQLFSRSFDDLAAAQLFFSDHALGLGLLDAGAQDLLVTASLVGHAGSDVWSSFNFSYALGISAVPEPQMWLLMLMGTVFVFRAGRRKA